VPIKGVLLLPMTLEQALQQHLATCDELYQLSLEENRFLRQEQRPPDEEWRTRKRDVAARLEQSLTQLRAAERHGGSRGGAVLEQARARSLQILLLDRENEQLLLRCSLGAPVRPVANLTPSRPAIARAYAGVR
jgi:hypothetical protein